MKKVIFICKGNMHRSPTAKALYNVLKKDDSTAESYGTMVEAEGRTGMKLSFYPDLINSINELKKYGADISNEECKQLYPKDLEGADKIIVMAEKEFTPEWLEKYDYERWDVEDGNNETPELAIEDVNRIKARVETLV